LYNVVNIGTTYWVPYLPIWTVDTCPKNDVISVSRKGFYALGWFRVEVRARVGGSFRFNVYPGKCP